MKKHLLIVVSTHLKTISIIIEISNMGPSAPCGFKETKEFYTSFRLSWRLARTPFPALLPATPRQKQHQPLCSNFEM